MVDRRLTCMVELLEDLHAGTGFGWMGLIDDTQARANDGHPVVRGWTVQGRLRETAELLLRAEHPLATRERIGRLFGFEGGVQSGSLVARSLVLRPDATHHGPDVVEITRTAREAHSRRPLDQTLRRIEAAAAGLKAEAEFRLHALTDGTATGAAAAPSDEDLSFLRLCIQQTASMGGGRSRGMGRIMVRQLAERPLSSAGSPDLGAAPRRVRVLLKALEPVCMAKTGHPGNVIETETHLPGRTLRGAWLSACRRLGASEESLDVLGDPAHAHFLDGLPVPTALIGQSPETSHPIERIRVIPLPLSATKRKASGASSQLPWWVEGEDDLQPWDSSGSTTRDALMTDAAEAGADGVFKRIRTEDVIIELADASDGAPTLWRATPSTQVLMRVRVPVHRTERRVDLRRPGALPATLAADEGELFSVETLPEGSMFLAEVLLRTPEAVAAFEAAAGPLLGDSVVDRAWLRVGRGGAPIRVEAWRGIGPEALKQVPEEFTITFTGDLVARASDLRFIEELDGAKLCELAGVPEAAKAITVLNAVQETSLMAGFNTAAGARRAHALAVRRGSALHVKASGPEGQRLREALSRLESQGLGLGERQEEGCGRFVIDHPVHKPLGQKSPPVPTPRPVKAIAEPLLEQAACKALAFFKEEVIKCDRPPTRSQWQWLRHQLERAGPERVAQVLQELEQHTRQLSGRQWAAQPRTGEGKPALVRLLQSRCEEITKSSGPQATSMFVQLLCRHAADMASVRTRAIPRDGGKA